MSSGQWPAALRYWVGPGIDGRFGLIIFLETDVSLWFSGGKLYGDNFTDAEIAGWFADKERGYFAITNGVARSRPEYDALYKCTFFRHVRKENLATCLAIGSAAGTMLVHWPHKFASSSS
jgi:hypothetical protein